MSHACDMIGQEDLQLIAAVAESGSVRRAAAVLRQHPATSYRKLSALERSLGIAIFEKQGGRFVPTPAGEEMVAAARDVEARLGEMSRKLAATQGRLEGELCITTTDTLVRIVLAALAPFKRTYPAVECRILISNSFADLSRREADVAIRPTVSPPESLVGRRLADYSFAPYSALGAPGDLGWIVPDQSLSAIPLARYCADHLEGSPALFVNSLWASAEACAAGLGRALLPTYLARLFPLERLGEPIPALRSAVWMLFHPDQRRSPKVRYFTAAVAPGLAKALRAST
jgi:DNA-binding transcriptional LysR family regulator